VYFQATNYCKGTGTKVKYTTADLNKIHSVANRQVLGKYLWCLEGSFNQTVMIGEDLWPAF